MNYLPIGCKDGPGGSEFEHMHGAVGWQEGDVEVAVRELLLDKYGNSVDVDVDVASDTDDDGRYVLRITVVVEPILAVQRKPPVDLVRHLRGRLMAHNVEDFPIMSYVSRSDADKRKRAAS